MKNWNSAKELFEYLNQNIEYLVIRNHEGFFDSILLDSHADIDLLINFQDRKRLISGLGATPRLERKDNIHFKVLVNGEFIPIDIRTVGDGYYDKKWEQCMLRERVFNDVGFYHMDNENYFWSLLYHSLYHKGFISKEYKIRLAKLYLNEMIDDINLLEERLACYMMEKGYYYSISKDKYLWYHFGEKCKGKIHAYPLYPFVKLTMHFKDFMKCRIKWRQNGNNESK